MALNRIATFSLIAASVIISVAALPTNEFADLQGPYCESIDRCCSNRRDECSVPILGTLCYCDEFCNGTRVHDCCPDYWTFCLNIKYETTTVFDPRPSNFTVGECYHDGRRIPWSHSYVDNCNECKCERFGDQFEMACEKNICILDPQIIDTVNRNPGQFGWTSSNYSDFWGRTLSDGVTYKLGTLKPHNFVLRMNPVRRIYDPKALPRHFDSEDNWPGYISGIQDQQWCGSSWAISTAAIASDRYAIVSRGVEAVKLSAQNLISCDLAGQQSCNGGHLDRAWSFVKFFGLVDESCFPYVASNVSCHIPRRGTLQSAGCQPPPYRERTARYSVGPAYRLGNETDIMHEILQSGPVQATMKVYQDFYSYSGGIYKHTDLDLYREHGYHSVRIVGWGEENTSNGYQKYWKVANSWGPNWGEDGYFRIIKGIDECEIESFVLATWPKVERKILISQQNEVQSY